MAAVRDGIATDTSTPALVTIERCTCTASDGFALRQDALKKIIDLGVAVSPAVSPR
ncbi:hypothetical protein OG241_06720 [Streptomyces sp. NBC_01390]|uniref:hypothetical protein n=1 Tax=Streptomyces sp. NBC_01390 TaxID=2903850 RepID=UPI003250D703